MAIVRLGTCGAVQAPAKLGDLLVASAGSIAIRCVKGSPAARLGGGWCALSAAGAVRRELHSGAGGQVGERAQAMRKHDAHGGCRSPAVF